MPTKKLVKTGIALVPVVITAKVLEKMIEDKPKRKKKKHKKVM